MNELGEFFITFRTTGINELLDQMKDLNVKLDSLNTSFEKGGTKGDSFFSKFTAWGLKLSGLAAGFIGVGKAINDAFKIGGEITKLNVAADVAGVKSEDVEALAIALAPLKGGQKDYASAANFYRQMTETQTEWWRGQYSEKVIEEMSRAGVTGLKATSSKEQWINGLVDALSYYQGQHTQQAIGARNLFAKAFGLTDEQMLLFAEGRDYVNQQLEYGRNHLVLSGEGNLRKAIEQTRAKMEFQESWERLVTDLIPLTTQIYDVLKIVVDVVRENIPYIADGIKEFVRIVTSIIDWLKERFGEDPMKGADEFNKVFYDAKGNRDSYALGAWVDLQNGVATSAQVAALYNKFKAAGLITPELQNAFDNELKKFSSGWAIVGDSKVRDALKNLKYDPNLKLLDVINNSLNTMPGNVNNSSTRNTTANFGNMYIYGTENVGRDVRNQLQTAVNGMESK